MTDLEKLAVECLYGCRFIPGCWAKRFARDLYSLRIGSPEKPLTEKQQRALWENVWRYRRQIPEFAIVAHADEVVNGAVALRFESELPVATADSVQRRA